MSRIQTNKGVVMREQFAQAHLARVEGMCNQWGLDLTVGCEHDCSYCHFHKAQSLAIRKENDGRPVLLALSLEEFLQREQYPPGLYLSPFTDPLAPSARGNLERVLRRVLPMSVRVAISTKGVIPRFIFRILAEYPENILLLIGVTSLNAERNRAVEPGCPPAEARLVNLRLAREYGLPFRFARLDPLLPGVDDAPEHLGSLLDRVVDEGAIQVSASYLYLTPMANRNRIAQKPYLGEAVDHCTEACPTSGGLGYSVPLDRKRETFTWLAEQCVQRGLAFGTCGCKDLRLDGEDFSTACSYPYMNECESAQGDRRKIGLPVCDNG